MAAGWGTDAQAAPRLDDMENGFSVLGRHALAIAPST